MIDSMLFAAPGNIGAALIAGLFGLLIGSFLNVVIHRIPAMMARESDNYVAHESGQVLFRPDNARRLHGRRLSKIARRRGGTADDARQLGAEGRAGIAADLVTR